MTGKIYYKRNLPHFQPSDSIYFVTFRLVNSLPKNVVEELRNENRKFQTEVNMLKDYNKKRKLIENHRKQYFLKFDQLLDKNNKGSLWLKEDKIAAIVSESIHYRNGKKYDLLSYCIMPNHVHILFDVTRFAESSRNSVSTYNLVKLMQGLKIHTAIESNKILNRAGQFWHHESYDHIIRDSNELVNTVNYILQNPVKAGFVSDYKDWKWTYMKENLFK